MLIRSLLMRPVVCFSPLFDVRSSVSFATPPLFFQFECATGELYNPIKQDTQHGKLRYYKHGDMMFNYGFFPQTWEDPDVIPPDTKCPGDNDPIDCEFLMRAHSRQQTAADSQRLSPHPFACLCTPACLSFARVGVEIGATQIRVGAIAAVKVLGLLGLIDDGQRA